MHSFGFHFFNNLLITALALLAGAGILHGLPRLGNSGRRLSTWLCHAPGLDLLITYFTVLPLFIGPLTGGWAGLLGAIAGQILGMQAWVFLHEAANKEAMRGPRIVKSLNRIVGRWQNHTAVWLTAIVTPMFWVIRLAEICIYPFLHRLVGLPAYNDTEWVNVSRQKFSGLVGHDLIWCLYCDWMTGVWSLGTEMLRNVESFWCPIRFYDNKKCDHCAIDFPDVNGGWTLAERNITQVAALVEEMHGHGDHSWFGKRVQVTVNGQAVESSSANLAAKT